MIKLALVSVRLFGVFSDWYLRKVIYLQIIIDRPHRTPLGLPCGKLLFMVESNDGEVREGLDSHLIPVQMRY